MDQVDDGVFYSLERKVTHLESGAIEALRSSYGRLLAPHAVVLDLMSSWRSHLPVGLGHVTGLGMNAAEMADNPQLHDSVVHDLNQQPILPFADQSFDAVVCSASVQYLIHPVAVFADVVRTLRPGGVMAVAFSNRCFFTKAVRVWLEGSDTDHRALVRGYLLAAGFKTIVDAQVPSPDDPLFLVTGVRPNAVSGWAGVPSGDGRHPG